MSSERCPECGRGAQGVYRQPDGSTTRNIERPACQAALLAMFDAYRDKDAGAAIEAFEELRNDAEKAFVNQVLDTNQRKWLAAVMQASRAQAGW